MNIRYLNYSNIHWELYLEVALEPLPVGALLEEVAHDLRLGVVARHARDGGADPAELPEGVVLVAGLALRRAPRHLWRRRRRGRGGRRRGGRLWSVLLRRSLLGSLFPRRAKEAL